MCCGQNRMQLRKTTSAPSRSKSVYVAAPQQHPPAHVTFAYIGDTGITVRGPVSGREYRFDRPGARVVVDTRDRVLLASIRQLRQVG